MLKVKVIASSTIPSLEKEVNEFFEENRGNQLATLQFQSNTNAHYAYITYQEISNTETEPPEQDRLRVEEVIEDMGANEYDNG